MACDKNVVLITVDSLRRDFVGVYDKRGGGLTPNLDELATASTVFEDAIAQGSYTRASVPSFFTSTYPWKLKQGGDITDRGTLATILKEQGYSTGFFHSNPFLSKALGYARGFDVFDDSLLPWDLNLSQKRIRQLGRFFRVVRRAPYLPAESLVKKSISWLDRVNSPFFLWLHLMDPHGPYRNQNESYLGKIRSEKLWNKAVNEPKKITEKERDKLVESYRSEVKYTDKQLSDLFDYISSEKENNIVVLTADHGEEFGEHGDYSHNPKPYEELLRVPLLFGAPGDLEDRITGPVALLDLLPSILDLLEIDRSPYSLDGHSFEPLLKGGDKKGREYVICQPGTDIICLRTSRWKYIVADQKDFLYDIGKDGDETKDLSGEKPELVEELKSILEREKSNYGSTDDSGEDGISGNENEETRKRLEDLGYL